MRYSALNNQGGLGRLNHGPEGGVLGDDVSPGLSVVVSDVANPTRCHCHNFFLILFIKLPLQQISEWLLLVVILSSIFILRSYFFFLLDNIFQFFIQFICFNLRIGSISSQFSISSIIYGSAPSDWPAAARCRCWTWNLDRSRLAEGILSLLFWPVYICSNSEMKHHDTFINLWVFLIWIHNLKE